MTDAHELGTGWRPDEASERDYTPKKGKVAELMAPTGIPDAMEMNAPLPSHVDLEKYCGPVKWQGRFSTCTAHVAVAMMELLENRAHGHFVEGSRLFLYKVVKNLLGETGDVSVFLRQTLGTLALVGLPPEKYWPYLNPGPFKAPNGVDPRIDDEPTAFCYAIARNYRSLVSYRLDEVGTPATDEVLHRAKAHLAAGFPVSLGIRLFASLKQSMNSGEIPLPLAENDAHTANHAVTIIGYDDTRVITNTLPGGRTSTGAFKIQNSWSTKWGQKGFGWVPYEYVKEDGVSGDMWTLTRAEWIATGSFGLD